MGFPSYISYHSQKLAAMYRGFSSIMISSRRSRSFSKIHSKTMATPQLSNEHVDNGIGEPKEIVIVPKEMGQWNVVKLNCHSKVQGGLCHVYLVGTTHGSKKSCEQVRAVINFLKPQVVFLELCSFRVNGLFHYDPKITELEDSKHGSEFLVAYEEALKYGGKVVLGDLPLNVVFWRIWERFPLLELWKADWKELEILKMVIMDVEEMDDVNMTLMIQTANKNFPTLMQTFQHERDQYMSSTLLSTASHHRSVVAVVGASHLQGIKKNLEAAF